jgi:hypothetical protein
LGLAKIMRRTEGKNYHQIDGFFLIQIKDKTLGFCIALHLHPKLLFKIFHV